MATLPNPLEQQVSPENLPEELQIALRELLLDLERQDEIPRRYEIKEILKRRLFFRGEQFWFWDEGQGLWMSPAQASASVVGWEDMEQPAFQHVTNIIQATILSLGSVLSQNNTASKFFPKKASDPKDVQTAKNASKVVDVIHRNNDFQNLVDQMTYYMGTDAFFGSYSRYVSDAEKFGTTESPIIEPQEVPTGPDTVQCPECQFEAEGTTEQQPTCPDCGQPMVDNPAPTATTPVQTGVMQTPNGQEVISIVPALQLKRTMWADEQSDFLYLDWITDLHKSKAMQAYPAAASKIESASGSEGEAGGVSSYEKIARRILYLGAGRQTTMVLKDLGTFRRAWLRPAAFYGLAGHSDTEATPCKRCQLLQLFPKGAKVVLFNEVFCESAAESMDDNWETMHTMPGEGQLRETLISSIMPLQEQLNDAINLLFEILMYGVPEGFADKKVLDFEARSTQTANAGNVTPVDLAPNQDIRASMQFTPATSPSAAMMQYIGWLMNEFRQLLSGDYAALAGGDTGSNDTAAGITIQRNQAMGRIGRAWRRMQVFCANTDLKSVKCFAKYRTEDLDTVKTSKSGEFESDTIRLEDVQGNVTAYPEVDAQYPTLQSDIRALLMGMWNAQNPLFLQLAQVPTNLEYIMRTLGCSDIEVPGEPQRKKTFRDIEQLVTQQPVPTQQVNPQTGQPILVPSVQPDKDIDDLKVAAETAKTWLISDAGLEARDTNAAGYENVKLYSMACTQLEQQDQIRKMIAAQAMQDQGPAADLGGAEDVPNPAEQKQKESSQPE